MDYYVAESYKGWKRIGMPFEKNGRKYTKIEGCCNRCGGNGIYAWGAVINGIPQYGGKCFKCEGTGKLRKEVRLYTEKEYASAQRAKACRREAAAVHRTERSERRKENWLKWNGFNEEGYTYVIFGNTYPIKEELKEAGCKFSRELKWHGPAAVEVQEDCYIEKIHWSDVYEWKAGIEEMIMLENGQDFLNEIFSKKSTGMYLGEVGERLKNLNVTFEGKVEFEGRYGLMNVYRFNYDGAQLSWFTKVEKDLKEGEEYLLSGTIKRHEVYRNVKTTYLNRCIIK